MDKIWEKFVRIAEDNDGVIRTSQVEAAGICRPMLKKYMDLGKLERIRKGLYILSGEVADEYVLLQAQNTKAIFSYGTALFFWGLSDRTPHILDVTLPQGLNATVLRKNNPNIRCHYIVNDLYELGITELMSPQGGTVRLYDKERCICDLIRDKEKIEMQLYSQALRDYFKSKPNNRKLLRYGKQFGIDDKIRTYMEVLSC